MIAYMRFNQRESETCSILINWLTEKDGIDFDLSTCMSGDFLAKVFSSDSGGIRTHAPKDWCLKPAP